MLEREKVPELQGFIPDPRGPLALYTPSWVHSAPSPSLFCKLFLSAPWWGRARGPGCFLVSALGALGLWEAGQYNGSARGGLRSSHQL